MASQAATDFLTKEIKASNNIVTFRLLSRQLSIHVGEAKRELELFYEAARRSKDPVFATFVLTGTPALNLEARGGSIEQASRHLILLVGEDELDDVTRWFDGTPAQHVYSLSPVPLKDHGLLTSVADRVRHLDKQKGQKHASQLGMLLSEDAPWSRDADGKSKRKVVEAPNKDTMIPKKPVPTPNPNQEVKPKSEHDVAPPVVSKGPTRQNTLNFGGPSKKSVGESVPKGAPKDKPSIEKKQSKVLSKMGKGEEEAVKNRIATPQPTSKPPSTASSKASHAETTGCIVVAKNVVGRSKRVLDSSDEDEPAPKNPRPAIKRKKSRVSEEDDEPTPTAQHNSASLAAMMDIDDDGVVNGRSTRETTPEHVPSTREAAAAAKAAKAEASKGVDHKQRVSKKKIPNGKKRVVKTRRVKNAKGYMVAEDYSSYEDADPNETDKADDTDVQSGTDYGEDIDIDVSGKVIQPKPKPKAAPSAPKAQTKRQPSDTSKLKKGKSGDAPKAGQPKLASFFGKK